jgi:hypothetical protein
MNIINFAENWKKLVTALIITVVALSSIWAFLNNQFIPRAEASQDHISIGERWEGEAKKAIEIKQDEKINFKYDQTLTERARDELIAVRDREIKRLEKQINCWEQQKSLECWRD